MADNLNQRLADELIQRDIGLLRVAARGERQVEDLIVALAEELARLVIRYDPSAVGKGAGQRRLERIIEESASLIRDAYRQIYREERAHLVDMMRDEQTFLPDAVGESFGGGLATITGLVRATTSVQDMRRIVDTRVMTASANDAATVKEFFERETASHHRRMTGALKQAFSQDETITQILARLDTVTKIQFRETASILQTSQSHVVNQMRTELMRENSHLFRGVIAIAVLDGRTSPVCISRSRGQWDLNTGSPLESSPIRIRFPGVPPWHHRCRTQLYPLTRAVREVGRMGNRDAVKALDSLTPEQRSLLNPDPPQDETYSQWLKRQSAVVQTQVLGPTRRQMWLDGDLSLTNLVTQKGRPLRLEELKRKARRAA